MGLVFPISYFQKENKFGKLPEFGEVHFGEDFEDKSQVDFNTDTITFIGKVYYLYMATLFDGIKRIFRRFNAEFVPQNVVVKVICYPNIAICIKLSGSKEETAMVNFLSRELIACQKFYNKIKKDNQKDGEPWCERNQFKIEVRQLTGKRMAFKVDPNTTVCELKLRIRNREGIQLHQFKLTFQWKDLDNDGQTLANYGIGDKATINMPLCLKGGGGIIGGGGAVGGGHR